MEYKIGDKIKVKNSGPMRRYSNFDYGIIKRIGIFKVGNNIVENSFPLYVRFSSYKFGADIPNSKTNYFSIDEVMPFKVAAPKQYIMKHEF